MKHIQNHLYDTTFYQTWQKPVKVVSSGTESKPGLDVETVRDEMGLLVERHLAAGENSMLVINVPCGVGKSHTAKYVAESIGEMTGNNISWFTPRHNGYTSLERNGEWTQIYGRRGDQHSKNGDIIEHGNCDYAECCRNVFKKGYSGAIVICSPKDENKRKPNVWKCPTPRDSCEFWQQFENNSHWHMPSEFIPACKLWSGRNSIVILDEIDSTSLLPPPVEINSAVINGWIKKHPKLDKLLNALKQFIRNNESHMTDSKLWDGLSEQFNEIYLVSMTDEYFFESDDYDIVSIDEVDNLPDSRCKDFLQRLGTEMFRYYRDKNPVVSRIVAHPGCFIFYPEMDLSKKFIDTRNESRTLKELPSVLLNASADIDGLKHLLVDDDYKIETYSPHVALNPGSTVTYILDRNNSKSSIKQRKVYHDRWIEQIKATIADIKTLVIATMDGERILKHELADLIASEQVILAHYGNVSGLNKYEIYQQVILAQPFNPDPTAVAERYRRIYGGTEGEALDLSTCYRQATIDNGETAYNVSVRTMADDRLRPIYEDWRNAEHYQAAHRVRPVLYGRSVVVLFAIPINGLDATDIVYNSTRETKMNELKHAADDLIDNQGYFTQADLVRSGFSKGYVSQNWNELGQELDLRKIEVMIPSERYPNGRKQKALTVGDWVIYNHNDGIGFRQSNGQITGISSEHFVYIDNRLMPRQSIVSSAYYVFD